ncbi:hypothetical protein [Qipengyuania qiaonensis]|uniref:Lipoprotein n=1 Tax=Qipengyuania qiaonensis TaxID=2867240 RepID=A0ABS7J832_9SPHN|nr:hypothetical protein [Qipengyuania qiaonensis]MBX7481137.1 hypothetical protein [Qipengyuania qiaonensis]
MARVSHNLQATAVCAAMCLSACSGDASPTIAEQGGETVDCAIAGAGDFGPDCRMIQTQADDTVVTVILHPDGGFRRFETASPFVVRDGALEARTAVDGEYLVLTVDSDRYRWPKDRWGE